MPVIYILAAAWLWSLIPFAVKIADASFTASFIGFARLAFGAVFFTLWELSRGHSLRLPSSRPEACLPGPRWMGLGMWILLAALGISGDFIFYAAGLHYTTASAATFIISTDGVMLALLGVLVLRERMSWMKALAGLAALTGLIIVGWSGQSLNTLFTSEYFLGNLLILCAGCCWAIYSLGQRVLARVAGGGMHWIFIIGALLAMSLAFSSPINHAPITLKSLGGLLYLGIGGTGLSYLLFFKGLSRLEAATVGVLTSTVPIFTMIQAHYWLNEEITRYIVSGGVMIITAILLMLRHQKVYGKASEPCSLASTS